MTSEVNNYSNCEARRLHLGLGARALVRQLESNSLLWEGTAQHGHVAVWIVKQSHLIWSRQLLVVVGLGLLLLSTFLLKLFA